jgi:hypothetical protein
MYINLHSTNSIHTIRFIIPMRIRYNFIKYIIIIIIIIFFL